jgi:hypothetical protein
LRWLGTPTGCVIKIIQSIYSFNSFDLIETVVSFFINVGKHYCALPRHVLRALLEFLSACDSLQKQIDCSTLLKKQPARAGRSTSKGNLQTTHLIRVRTGFVGGGEPDKNREWKLLYSTSEEHCLVTGARASEEACFKRALRRAFEIVQGNHWTAGSNFTISLQNLTIFFLIRLIGFLS